MLRPIDRWMLEHVLPYESAFLARAMKILRNEDDAREIVQDVLVRLLSTDGWPAIESPRAYALQMVRNLAVERLRRSRIIAFEALQEVEALQILDDGPDAFRISAGRDQMAQVARALDALPEKSRTVIVRTRLSGETPTSLAKEMGISLSTLEKRLYRGLAALSRALRPDGSEPAIGVSDDCVRRPAEAHCRASA